MSSVVAFLLGLLGAVAVVTWRRHQQEEHWWDERVNERLKHL